MKHFLRHFFIPHTSNNHRAKALHIDSLLCYVLLFAIFNLGIRIIHRDYPNVLGYATDIHVEQLLAATNAQRIAAGLQPLMLNATLSQAAAAKAQDMFANNYWAHNSPQGKTPWVFIQGAGYQYTMAGENLAKNFSTSQGVVDAWMASPTHKANIVKSGYQDVGFAVVNGVLNGGEKTLVVQMFGTGSSIAQAPQPQTVVPEKAAAVDQNTLPIQSEGQPVPVVPVIVPEQSSQSIGTVLSSAFSAFTSRPMFNIPSLTRDVAFLFIGLIVGVLVIDGFVVSKKRLVRVAGHNVAHILFFIALFTALTIVKRGILL
jgi:hypothetical protein